MDELAVAAQRGHGRGSKIRSTCCSRCATSSRCSSYLHQVVALGTTTVWLLLACCVAAFPAACEPPAANDFKKHIALASTTGTMRKNYVPVAAVFHHLCFLQPVSDEAVNDIEKDIARTFPATRRFTTAEGQQALRRVLHAYAAYDPEVSCQMSV